MEFRPFNDGGSLQVQERLVQVPPTASVKGMFFQAIAEQVRRATRRAAEKSSPTSVPWRGEAATAPAKARDATRLRS